MINLQQGHDPFWAREHRSDIDSFVRREQLTFIVGDRVAGRALLDAIGHAVGSVPVSVSQACLTPELVQNEAELVERLRAATLLYDIETILWKPWLGLDVLRFLRRLAGQRGVVVLWPGAISNRTATFSLPGRRDHVSFETRRLNVLRPVPTRFPDEVPYTLERIP